MKYTIFVDTGSMTMKLVLHMYKYIHIQDVTFLVCTYLKYRYKTYKQVDFHEWLDI